MFGKKSSEKSEKNVFLYSHKYRYQKMGGKNARNNFSRNTRIVRTKNGKKSSEKSEKNFFLYSHEYHYQKMGAIKSAKQFFQKHTNSASKKSWKKKSSEKSAKNVFL